MYIDKNNRHIALNQCRTNDDASFDVVSMFRRRWIKIVCLQNNLIFTIVGGGEAPKAVSGRLVAATWWLYGFLLIAFYTANLAAFLTVFRLETPITSLDDLSKQQSVQYGPMNGTSALVYFERMKDIENQFYR